MFDRLSAVEERFVQIEQALVEPNILGKPQEYQKLAREHAEIAPLVETYRKYRDVVRQLEDSKHLLRLEKDHDMRELIKEEIESLEQTREVLLRELKLLLLPQDPNDEKNVILEIRAGTGGEEAALFAADLLRMYVRYAEERGWKVEVLGSHLTEMGGFREIIVNISGKGAYSRLKYERGVHRVQRIPITENQGRIHTSAVTVAVLPEAEEVDVDIDPNDLRIDVFRSSGPGGQSVNTTDSAVRITHIPTGIVVTCQDEKSQHKNKAKAMKVLRARLYELKKKEQEEQIARERRAQVGTGDRSERIRTYNFPQNRITDHRINLTLYKLDHVMNGELDEIIDSLITYDQAEQIKNLGF